MKIRHFELFSFVTSLVVAFGLTGCNSSQTGTAQNQPANTTTGDPANGNLASAQQYTDQPGYQSGYPAQAPSSSAAPEGYAPPAESSRNSRTRGYSDRNYSQEDYYAPPPADYYNSPGYDQTYDQASYEEPIYAQEPPPPLLSYDQPPAPGDDYVWTPGTWSYANDGYYWVPGTWVLAPYIGALWTPPWWDFEDGHYLRHAGYWGPHIGFYGGIDYGYGYTGRGYYGAYWDQGHLDYNRTVNNVNITVVHNVYNAPVPNQGGSRVSYNGGPGGTNARPTPQELAVVHDPRTPPVAAQVQHARQAAANPAQFARGGQAKPAALVASKPLATPYKAPAPRPPAAAVRVAQQAPQTPPPTARPGLQATRVPENNPAPQNQQPFRPLNPAQRPAAPPVAQNRAQQAPNIQRPEPQSRPQTQAPPQSPVPLSRPQTQPPAATRPAPVERPQAQPPAPARPVPQARPEPIPTTPPRPAPVARPQTEQPAPAARPAPQAHPVEPPRAAPETRPQAAPPRSAPEARPQAAPPPRPAPEARPQAAPPPRPAPEARPQAPPPRPAQQARPAPPQHGNSQNKDERK